MEHVPIDEVEENLTAATLRRPLTDALGVEGFAMNYYEVAPGEKLSNALHAHLDQEEVFVVLAGTLTFETDEGPVEVGEREGLRFAPGEFQHGHNGGGERAVLLAFGAPAETSDTRMECPACGARDAPEIRRTDAGDAIVFSCGACGAEINRMT